MNAAASTAPAVFGITGWSGSGKTALIVGLLPEFRRRGYRVATIKHAHHDFDIDKPEKDSHKHRTAGASETVISSANRWAIVHENRGTPEPGLPDLIARLSPTDIVLVEGYKSHPHPKIEVCRPSMGAPLLCTENATIQAVASDAPVDGATVPVIDLNNPADVADFILSRCGLDARLTGVV